MELIDRRCRRTEGGKSCGALRGSASALPHGQRIDGDRRYRMIDELRIIIVDTCYLDFITAT
jgi:hypothetical protein